MGFWSGLGKGLLVGGGALAAPFTGGASLATIIPAIGAGASALASGRAQGRIDEARLGGQYDANRLAAARALEDALLGRSQLDLQQRQFALNAPGQRAGNSVRGDVLANAQDAQVQGPIVGTKGQIPQITGGLRPSLLSGNSRQLGSQMSRDALLSQMQGDQFSALPPPNIPTPTPLPKPNALDSILGGIGVAGGVADLMQNPSLRQKYAPKVPEIPGTWGDW